MLSPERAPQPDNSHLFTEEIVTIGRFLDGGRQLTPDTLKQAYESVLPRVKSLCRTPVLGRYLPPHITHLSEPLPYQSPEGSPCTLLLGLSVVELTASGEERHTISLLAQLEDLPTPIPIVTLSSTSLSGPNQAGRSTNGWRDNHPDDLQSIFSTLEAFDGQTAPF